MRVQECQECIKSEKQIFIMRQQLETCFDMLQAITQMPENAGRCKAVEVIKSARLKRTRGGIYHKNSVKVSLADIETSICKLDKFIQENVPKAMIRGSRKNFQKSQLSSGSLIPVKDFKTKRDQYRNAATQVESIEHRNATTQVESIEPHKIS